MKRYRLALLLAAALIATAGEAQTQQPVQSGSLSNQSIQPAPAPIADPPPAASVRTAESKAAPKAVKKVPPIRVAGWTNWPTGPKTAAGNEVLVPYAKSKGKIVYVFQKEAAKSEKAERGYYWRRPNASWYLATNHELELRAFSQAKSDQEFRETRGKK